MTNISYDECTIIACVKDIENGTVMYKFWEPRTDNYIFIKVPIEYYYMTTGKRKWNYRIDKLVEKEY